MAECLKLAAAQKKKLLDDLSTTQKPFLHDHPYSYPTRTSDQFRDPTFDEMPVGTRMINNKIFKQEIGIVKKSQATRRDRWGCNVNHKSLF